MSAPVGVLAVMDDRIEQARSRHGCRSDKPEPIGITEFREARAAVAELIEASEGQHKAIDWLMARLIETDPDFRPTASPAWPLLLAGNAALARVKAVQS